MNDVRIYVSNLSVGINISNLSVRYIFFISSDAMNTLLKLPLQQ